MADPVTPAAVNPATALLAARLEGRTVKEAAEAAGLSERQAYRVLARPEFRETLATRRRELVDAVAARLADAADDAVDTLLVLQGESTPASTRLSAARCLLQYMLEASAAADAQELGPRLEALEAALERMAGRGGRGVKAA